MKINLVKYILGVLAFTFVLTGCSKNEDALTTVVSNKQDIMTFKSVEEFNTTVQKVNSMNPEERRTWEKSQGFKSFGTICDEVFKSIDPTNFKSLQEVKDSVAALSSFLEIGQNKNGKYFVDAKESTNPARFIMNKDKMYIVDNLVYKQFDNELVSRNISEIENLKELKLNSSVNTLKKVITYGYAYANNVNYFEQWGINGNYAIKVTFKTYLIAGPMGYLRQHDYIFNNYKWTLWVYWGNYTSHTYSNIKTVTADDYQIDQNSPINHRLSTGYYYNADEYTYSNTLNYITPIYTSTPYYTEILVSASNNKGCVINEHYIR
jgi:hypothetical protein